MENFKAIEALSATAGHIASVQTTLERLAAVRDDAWAQMLAATARLYREGALGLEDLAVLAEELKASYGPGHSKVWNATMPMKLQRLQGLVRDRARFEPNGPNGSWLGTFPIGHAPAPMLGVSIVYVLFDATNEPAYVGSTATFRIRMAEHRKTKPGITRWAAYPCRDREHAYEMEVELLRQHKPRMNKKVGR